MDDRQQYRNWRAEPWEEPYPNRRGGGRGRILFGVFLTLIVVGVCLSLAWSWWRANVAPPLPDYGYGWSFPVPTYGVETQTEKEEPERAPVGTGVTMQVHSAKGKPELSYQELYRQCVNGVVSVRVASSEGDFLGTGIVMTEDGYIITNCHVVDDCHTVTVAWEDGQERNALLVGKDEETDLAVLKVEAQGLTALEFGDSSELEVGDEALAIGNPLGEYLRGTLTNGIISAIDRAITMNGYSMTLIQTTAALNNGNSGGPLLNIYGQVVGINNMKIMSNFSTVEGLGFAIPTSVAKDVVDELIERGYVSRAVIGILCSAVSADYLEREDFSGGLCIHEVTPGSKAYDTELEAGDVIVEANGVPVRSMEDLSAVRDGMGIGDVITMTVFRGEEETLVVDVELCDQRDLQ